MKKRVKRFEYDEKESLPNHTLSNSAPSPASLRKEDLAGYSGLVTGSPGRANYNDVRTDWALEKFVSTIPNSVMTAGYRIMDDDTAPERILEFRRYIDSLLFDSRLLSALEGANFSPFCYLILVTDMDSLEKPLDMNRIGTNSVKNFVLATSEELTPFGYDRDVASLNYRKPVVYQFMDNQVNLQYVHYTRVFSFTYNTPEFLDWIYQEDSFRYNPIDRYREIPQQHRDAMRSISYLLSEASVDVVQVPGLTKMLRSKKERKALKALAESNINNKSVFRSLFLDKEYAYERKGAEVGGLNELSATMASNLALPQGIPISKYLGTPPTGFSSTGNMELSNWREIISSVQTFILKPVLDKLIPLLWKSFTGQENPNISYVFNPPDTESFSEKAVREQVEVKSLALLVKQGVLTTEEARAELVQRGIVDNVIPNKPLGGLSVSETNSGGDDEGGMDG